MCLFSCESGVDEAKDRVRGNEVDDAEENVGGCTATTDGVEMDDDYVVVQVGNS